MKYTHLIIVPLFAESLFRLFKRFNYLQNYKNLKRLPDSLFQAS